MFDTSKFDKNYLNKLSGEGFENLKDSFDQIDTIFCKEKTLPTGRFNEFNAIKCLEICLKLLECNPSLNLKSKIGIICTTINQKKIVKYFLENNNEFEILKTLDIKIDTIDNFQGREKEIIIVDFVRAKMKLKKILDGK